MFTTQRRHLDVISVSALDLFASALGVFILLAIVLFPYYLKQPAQEAETEGAQAEYDRAAADLEDARRLVAVLTAERIGAEAQMRSAEEALRHARAGLTEALAAQDTAARNAANAVKAVPRPAPPRQKATFKIPDLDLVVVMDTTGSMRHELEDVQQNLLGIIRVLHRLAPSLHVGFVAFKDREDDYYMREFPLTAMDAGNTRRILSFVEMLNASGGGDTPEPVAAALARAVAMNWRPDAAGRIIVVGDAPSHRIDWQSAFGSAARFSTSAQSGGHGRRVSAIYTGPAREDAAKFFSELALAGNGDFVFHRGRMVESVLLSVLEKPS